MPTREEYNQCMKPYISGQHKDRKLSFCAGAKICTGKASTIEEAEKICRELPPKEPRIRKTRLTANTCSTQSIDTITNCLVTHINFNASDMNKELRDNLARCMCGRKEKKVNKAEQAILALDPEQRRSLLQFMTEHSTSIKAGV
jgi:hypothetical protein